MLIPLLPGAGEFSADPGFGWNRSTPASWSGTNTAAPSSCGWRGLRPTEVRRAGRGRSQAGVLEISRSPRPGLIGSSGRISPAGTAPAGSTPSRSGSLEEAVLAACHLPGHKLFVFAEEPATCGSEARRDRGIAVWRRLQGPAGPLPGDRPGHSPRQRPPWPGWWRWCSAWPGPGIRGREI